jgi:hypothetical protein
VRKDKWDRQGEAKVKEVDNVPSLKGWALEAQKHPEFLSIIKSREFQSNTFGSFLKPGLAALETKERTTNVVDIRHKRDEH